jgi:AcrR family transcriptional regulator
MPARRRDPERTRAKLLRAATREFGARGYAGARIERIVAAAECNIRMVYHHFGSKSGLYAAAVEAAYADLRAQEAELALNPADPLGSLDALLRFTIRYFADHRDFEGLIRSENDLGGRVVSGLRSIGASGELLQERLGAIVAAGEAAGLFRPGVDVAQLYVTITALSRFHLANAFSLSAVLGTDLRDPAWRAAWTDHAIDLIRRYVLTDGR